MTTALQSWEAFVDPGWTSEFTYERGSGYYLHHGMVYLSGVLRSTAGSGQTLLAGLPPELRPSEDVALTLVIDPFFTSDPCNPALELPTTYAATMHTDGKLTLDEPLPVQVTETPPAGTWFYYDPTGTLQPQYTAPLKLALCLGGARWPVAAGSDSYASTSLAPYLFAEHFEDIDSTFSIHGSRVHVDGHIRALVNGASIMLIPTPPGTTAGFVGIAADISAFGPYPAETAAGYSELRRDELINGTGDSPPLAEGSPPKARSNSGPESGGRNFNTTGEKAGLYGNRQVWTTKVEHGRYSCTYERFIEPLHIKDGPITWECRSPGSTPESITPSLGGLLSQVTPTPEWFLVDIEAFYSGDNADHGNCPPGEDVAHVGDCNDGFEGPVPKFAHPQFAGTIHEFNGTLIVIPPEKEEGPHETSFTGWVAPPVSLYKGTGADLAGLDPKLLWHISQVGSGVPTVSAPGGTINEATLRVTVEIIPYYERRQIGLKAGDELDLTGSGWYGVAGALALGALTRGTVPVTRRVAGRTS